MKVKFAHLSKYYQKKLFKSFIFFLTRHQPKGNPLAHVSFVVGGGEIDTPRGEGEVSFIEIR